MHVGQGSAEMPADFIAPPFTNTSKTSPENPRTSRRTPLRGFFESVISLCIPAISKQVAFQAYPQVIQHSTVFQHWFKGHVQSINYRVTDSRLGAQGRQVV
jgi:hypothetical protein